MSTISLVWFKRDLRIDDHRPLVEAAKQGPVLPLYIVEPEYWRQSDASARQQDFVAESLVELDRDLGRIGQPLLIETGHAVEVLKRLHRHWQFTAIHCHEETGNGWTFDRDRAIRAWCRANAVALHEYPQFGVQRGLTRRDGWARHWESYMAEPALTPPARLEPLLDTRLPQRPFANAPAFDQTSCPQRQPGGIGAGESVLKSFLEHRGQAYRGGISSPLSAETAGSRLSPYIAWGNLSLRRIVQSTRKVMDRHREAGNSRLVASLRSFDQRLHWHCHFIQKLEQRPDIEFENMHRGFDGMRENDFDPALFKAWAEGETGYPLVDACMRFLIQHGWLNFRMRAMLMSFAAYHLWLHWREPSLHLARLFTDYEPGIHYNQCQMQSGTTGINTPRIYNPVKQARDQDPQGRFVRRWVPELTELPTEFIFEPWQLGLSAREKLGAGGYPEPVVDYLQAARLARNRLGEYRRAPGFRDQANAVHQALGSRRSPRRKKAAKKAANPRQTRLL